MSRYTRKKRTRLYLENPHCHWCGKLTILLPADHGYKELPPNAATLDHEVARPIKGFGNPTRIFLACHECNYSRNENDKIAHAEIYVKDRVRRAAIGYVKIEATATAVRLMMITGRIIDIPNFVRNSIETVNEYFDSSEYEKDYLSAGFDSKYYSSDTMYDIM